jgi:hypothetical protein
MRCQSSELRRVAAQQANNNDPPRKIGSDATSLRPLPPNKTTNIRKKTGIHSPQAKLRPADERAVRVDLLFITFAIQGVRSPQCAR